ncbi:hypothetical protein L861_15185 [Litchfieldella anticariensis FP35 = DSM 16096]|uniref:T6SS Phospholipase effector Tle1-like catalytic domain-containing protein n=1 Tax=Litchfieldella anticariensis (strain DSM 16096 / CECT 5854 / CIP 108499 / LMG 22089 / FP35) TaxID=1121939 RepID=S2KPK1_LITA3|nr:DUF2235 domain-containing protein [Halomonas anticariensis]EPC02378.1 hypothetical protein L861_15185 [Halomonas anticariensis FP35 = DSM 16096]
MDQTSMLEVPWTPRLTQSIDGRGVILGVVLFDGTRNDRLNVPSNERQTVVAHLNERLKGNASIEFLRYYRGVGTQQQSFMALVDAATGYTLKDTAENAADEVIAAIDEVLLHTPDTDIRLLVSGFSRGGAAARHFMNVLEQRWRFQGRSGSPPRFYALIFDTVATGQRENLSLQVPVSADLFYHFVSIDERRVLFKPIIDIPQNRVSGRIVTILLPGAHSDVGTSYISGVGSEYLAKIDALLSGMGLLSQQCFSVDGDARAQGKHDSRWMLERLLGVGAPDTKDEPRSRTAFSLPASPLPNDFWANWNSRMLSLEFNEGFSIPLCTQRNELRPPEFEVTRVKGGFEVVSLPAIYQPSARILIEDDRYFLAYTFDGNTISKVEVAAYVLDGITEDHSAKLSLSIVEDGDGENHHYWWFLDDEREQRIDDTYR